MRLPIVVPIESRDGTLLRDKKMQNFMATPTNVGIKADKRPGTWDDGAFNGIGTGLGIFAYGNSVYCWGAIPLSPTNVSTTNLNKFIVSNTIVDPTNSDYYISALTPAHKFQTGNFFA